MKRLIASIMLALVLIPAAVFGAASLMPSPNPQFFTSAGTPCSSCRLYFYTSGTTSAQDTYTTSAMSVPNANPIVLNSRGESATPIFMTGTYTVVLKTAALAQIWSRDGITGILDASTVAGTERWLASGVTPSYYSANTFKTNGDNSTLFEAGRRVKIVVSAGTYYGRISASLYSVSTTSTTVALDTGTLDTGISAVSVGIETPTNSAISLDSIVTGTASGTMKWTGTQTVTGAIISSGSNTFTGSSYVSGTVNGSIPLNASIASSATATISGIIPITGDMSSSGTNTWNGTQFRVGRLISSATATITGILPITGNISSSGANTWTGVNTFTGNNSFTGSNSITGTNTFTGINTFTNGLITSTTITGNIESATALKKYDGSANNLYYYSLIGLSSGVLASGQTYTYDASAFLPSGKSYGLMSSVSSSAPSINIWLDSSRIVNIHNSHATNTFPGADFIIWLFSN